MSAAPEDPRGRRLGRRRRRPRSDRRGHYLWPQLLTTGNLFWGFFAIIQAQAGNFDRAALGIFLAGLCDLLDGRVARLSRSTSAFGREYDSIADVVSFGVAPAILAFEAGNLSALARTGWILAFLYTACAALRLARFNVSSSRFRGRFEGLPSPAAAATVASTQWFVSFLRERGVTIDVPEAAVALSLTAIGLLMVSAIPYRSFKELDLRHSYRAVVVSVLALAVLVQEPSVTFFAVGVGYVTLGPAEWLWRYLANRPIEELSEALEPPKEAT